MKGKVKFFHSDKGWGFVTGDDGKELFVHQSDIEMDGYRVLGEEQEVEYEVGQGEKGPKAINVKPIGEPPVSVHTDRLQNKFHSKRDRDDRRH